ncbi:efflux RND transporter periplasmic adaptor subunit [Coleofasciculus sp. FACHB-SPT36]|uniref:efflux RND transporter periplasmic adaptor subunit n=1 Tax=Cyanophyceae TaxID=3028117 RepID=UPI00168A6213|nr:efflux RND transporter periplasmic adaptor subunit [Coleofasciculus sp. FACHB-SPT36]MBD2537654.1 efflux RND transporter periplasmic adaptor subunit [Coleofasciculus sp. FACHB-SPT36]
MDEAPKKIEVDELDETWDGDEESSDDGWKRSDRKKRALSGWKGVALGVGIGIALTAGGMKLLSQPKTAKKPDATQQAAPPSQSVTATVAQSAEVARTLTTSGTVEARELIPVLSQTTGLQIQRVLVDEGQTVEAGQVMAVLDNSVLQAQLDRGKAQLESSQAAVRQRQAALAQSRATLAEAQRNLQRYQQLAQAGAISRQELDARATTAATAREEVRLAQANINSAEAEVRSSAANLQQLQTQLGQTQVRAPARGIVTRPKVDDEIQQIARIGDVTSGSKPLFSIIRNGQLELEAQLPAIQLPQVKIGAPATITSENDSRVRLQGRVREIAPLVNAQRREATVTIDLPQPSSGESLSLRPGMFARAAITTTTTTGVTVPAKAVLPQPDGSAIVFLLSGEDTVQARKVELGEVATGDTREIKSGLKPGDRVVVAGAGYLKEGDKVRVVNGQ